MATMICSRCHQFGIYWKNLAGISPYTYCPNCKSNQLPIPEEPEPEEEQEDEEPKPCGPSPGLPDDERALEWLTKFYDSWYYNESGCRMGEEPVESALKSLAHIKARLAAGRPKAVSVTREQVEAQSEYLTDNGYHSILALRMPDVYSMLRDIGVSVDDALTLPVLDAKTGKEVKP